MGTRHLTMVVLDKQIKVAQYGQWDGYFSGQGKSIVKFINSMDLPKFVLAIRDCKFTNEEDIKNKWIECGANPNSDMVDMGVSKKFHENYPQFHRDVGSGILDLICNKGVRELEDNTTFISDSLFCEYAYVIDLDTKRLEVYKGCNTQPLAESERFYSKDFTKYKSSEDIYYPCKLYDSVSFEDLSIMGLGYIKYLENLESAEEDKED